MARFQMTIGRHTAPFQIPIALIDVVVANNESDLFDACLIGSVNGSTLFHFVSRVAPCDQRGSVMHIRNMGIYDIPIQLVITTSIHSMKHASIRIVFKDERGEILGMWNELNVEWSAC